MPSFEADYSAQDDLAKDHLAEHRDSRQDRDRIRALLVDYDAEDAFAFSRLLVQSKHIDFSVSLCGKADAAKDLLRLYDFDIVYVDYWLGFETSIPFIAEIVRRNHAPVVMLDGLDSPDVRRCAYRAGAAGFLAKEDLSVRTVESVTLAILRHKHSVFDVFSRRLAESPSRRAGGSIPQGGESGVLAADTQGLPHSADSVEKLWGSAIVLRLKAYFSRFEY